jgi:hypothetical protein
MRSPYLPTPDSITVCYDARVRVVSYGPGNWRTEIKDGDGEFDITGPAYSSKAEALSRIDYALWIGYGDPMPGIPDAPFVSGYTDRAGIDNRANSALLRIERITAMTHYPSAVRLVLVAQVMAGEPILTDTASPAAYEVRALAARMPEYPGSPSN